MHCCRCADTVLQKGIWWKWGALCLQQHNLGSIGSVGNSLLQQHISSAHLKFMHLIFIKVHAVSDVCRLRKEQENIRLRL